MAPAPGQHRHYLIPLGLPGLGHGQHVREVAEEGQRRLSPDRPIGQQVRVVGLASVSQIRPLGNMLTLRLIMWTWDVGAPATISWGED